MIHLSWPTLINIPEFQEFVGEICEQADHSSTEDQENLPNVHPL